MASVAVDLTPIVTSLLERPFDQPSLDRAYSAVKGHPQAYATALRCAAKKTRDTLAAAYWFAEAARVHESMDDLGGAVALLWRALECDRADPRPRELLAAAMVRLSMRAGLAFTFTPGTQPLAASRPAAGEAGAMETGLRPPGPDGYQDGLPDLFGVESSQPQREDAGSYATGDQEPTTGVVTRATLPSLQLPINPPEEDEDEVAPVTVGGALYVTRMKSITNEAAAPAPVSSGPARPDGDELEQSASSAGAATDRVEQLLPPNGTNEESGVIELTRPAEGEFFLRSLADAAPGPAPRNEPRKEEPALDDVYAEQEAPPTVRPAGDRLVGGLFEALHELHFQPDVRAGAAFLCTTLKEKMRPATTLVHLYDINSGHFLIVSAEASRAVALIDYATPEDDAFIAEIMKSEESTLVSEPSTDPRLSRGRWLLVEPKRSVLCAPVASEGRQLGLIELADPVDGGAFTDDDRNALMYAASALSRFLDRRGLVLSDEPERSSPGPD